jgi:type III secretion protein V
VKPDRLLLDPASPADGLEDPQSGEPFGPFARVTWVSHAGPAARTLTAEEVIAAHADHVVRRHGSLMIGLQEVQWMLRMVQRDAPELAAETARVVPPQRMADVLRRLLQEDIPVRNLHAICESLVKRTPTEEDNIALAELVRIDLGRFITSRHVGGRRELQAILFDSTLLDRVQKAIERTPRGNMLLLSPAVKQEIREQVRNLAGGANRQVVAITSADVRRYVKSLIEPVAPQLPVLSYQELDEDVSLQPVGWVTNPEAA